MNSEQSSHCQLRDRTRRRRRAYANDEVMFEAWLSPPQLSQYAVYSVCRWKHWVPMAFPMYCSTFSGDPPAPRKILLAQVADSLLTILPSATIGYGVYDPCTHLDENQTHPLGIVV